jgi:hypothetical protein
MDTRLKTEMKNIRHRSAALVATALILVGCGDSREEQEAQLRKIGASVDANYNAKKAAQLKLIGQAYLAHCQTNSIGPDGPEALLGALAALDTAPAEVDDIRKALDERRYSVIWSISLTENTNWNQGQALAWDDNLDHKHPGQVLTGDLKVKSVSLKTFNQLPKFGGRTRAVLGNGKLSRMALTPSAFPMKERMPDLPGSIPPPLNLPLNLKDLDLVNRNSKLEEIIAALNSDTIQSQAMALTVLDFREDKGPNEAVCQALVSLLASDTEVMGEEVMGAIEPWLTGKGLKSMEKVLSEITDPELAPVMRKFGAEIGARYHAMTNGFVRPLFEPLEKQ